MIMVIVTAIANTTKGIATIVPAINNNSFIFLSPIIQYKSIMTGIEGNVNTYLKFFRTFSYKIWSEIPT